MADTTQTPTIPQQFERTDDFRDLYANNVIFEQSAWDLKLIFGTIDQSSGTTTIKQQLAVTIPWPQAKLALFWLRFQIEAAEIGFEAKIPIRRELLPAEWPQLSEEEEQNPETKKLGELYTKLRAEFLIDK